MAGGASMTPADVHARFAALPGSEQIASEFALSGARWWLRRRRPTCIWEVGGGIGCLSQVLVNYLESWQNGPFPRQTAYPRLFVEEPDEWCYHAWHENVRMEAWPLAIRWSTEFYEPDEAIDFLVIDGGDTRGDYYANLARRAVILWEGGRREQRRVFRAMWKGVRPFVMATCRPADRSKGYTVAIMEPTFGERAWFIGVRMREWILDALARASGRAIGKRRTM